MPFKKDFIWGAATASHQIEGAAFSDGKGRSVWDDFAHNPSNIADGRNADTACDHYHLYKEDVALMAKLGIKAYRFSVSWPRILPEGTGKLNQKGIDFYNSLIDELLKYGITPYLTLFHWDYPSALQEKGGFENDKSPEWFGEYTRVVTKNFGDRVKHYFTLNEPTAFVGVGHCLGLHAPGLKLPNERTVKIAHNVLKSHGTAVKIIRETVENSVVSAAPCSLPPIPVTESTEDIEAARKLYFSVPEKGFDWALCCSWWCDPIFKGEYPKDGLKFLEKYLPESYKEDMKLICQPLDFVGQNIYQGYFVKEKDGKAQKLPFPAGYPHTDIGWPITPKALYWGPKFLYERYRLPVIITESGMASSDFPFSDGKIHDIQRIDCLGNYLKELKKAAESGVDIGGYFVWSFYDNFEWQEGYNMRFGLVYTDYETQKRIPKDSAFWYKTTMEENGEKL